MEDVGYVFENTQREKDVLASAQDILTEAEFLTLVKADITGEFIGNHDEQTLTGFRLWPDRPLPTFASDPKFLHVLASVQPGLTARGEDEKGITVQYRLKQADSLELAIELVCEALVQKIWTERRRWWRTVSTPWLPSSFGIGSQWTWMSMSPFWNS